MVNRHRHRALTVRSIKNLIKTAPLSSLWVLSVFLSSFYAATSLSRPLEKCCSPAAIVALRIRTELFLAER